MPAFDVSPAAPHELLPACRLLFAAASAEHFGNWLRLADSDPSGLIVARAGGKLRAAALVQTLPGALGLAWAPRGESREAEDAATAAACDWLRARGVKVCQAFASAAEAAGMAPLERHGFRHTTQLALLRRDLALTALPPEPRRPLTYRPEAPPLGAEFRRVLLATHEGTLDCPELSGARTAEELLAGFDEPTPGGGWDLACDGGEPVGVVVQAPGAEPESADLTYFGVVPAHRKRGVGGDLLAHGLRAFAAAGVRLLTLSVDARNAPAMKLYARHGFTEYDRREVWLATLKADEPHDERRKGTIREEE